MILGCLAFSILEANGVRELQISTPSPLNKSVHFYYRQPKQPNVVGMLLLMPGSNGSGQALLNSKNGWCDFADEVGLVLLAPTFKTTLEEIHSRQGYYYPDQWSGQATLEAIDRIGAITGANHRQILIFGFSAGAHSRTGSRCGSRNASRLSWHIPPDGGIPLLWLFAAFRL